MGVYISFYDYLYYVMKGVNVNNCEICDEVMEVVEYADGGSGVKDGKFSVVKSWSNTTNDKGYRTANTKSLNIHRKCGFKALVNAGVDITSLI